MARDIPLLALNPMIRTMRKNVRALCTKDIAIYQAPVGYNVAICTCMVLMLSCVLVSVVHNVLYAPSCYSK